MLFQVDDDSGLLALLDPDAYQSFVDADWTGDQLQAHFLRQMAARRLLIWASGREHLWKVEVALQSASTPGFREVTGSLHASHGRLLLTSYDSLTMAAQFEDTVLPEAHEQGQVLVVAPGFYDCRVVQLSDPESDAFLEESINFLYELTPTLDPRPAWDHIPWLGA